jgi:hypothetical protein
LAIFKRFTGGPYSLVDFAQSVQHKPFFDDLRAGDNGYLAEMSSSAQTAEQPYLIVGIIVAEKYGFPCIPKAADSKERSINESFWSIRT